MDRPGSWAADFPGASVVESQRRLCSPVQKGQRDVGVILAPEDRAVRAYD
jgi:hypothetical protein